MLDESAHQFMMLMPAHPYLKCMLHAVHVQGAHRHKVARISILCLYPILYLTDFFPQSCDSLPET